MRFDPEWEAFEGIFGGAVIASLVAAARVEGYAPLSISVHFMGAVRLGEFQLRTVTVHEGTLTASLEIELIQKYRRVAAAVKMGRTPGSRVSEQRLDLSAEPRPEAVTPVQMPYGPYPYERHFDTRLIPDRGTSWTERARAWVRVDGAANADLGPYELACLFLDALPPGLFFGELRPAFVPTVDFTAHFAPGVCAVADEWMYVSRDTYWATRDFCLEGASLHTSAGQVVAHATQTRRVRWLDG